MTPPRIVSLACLSLCLSLCLSFCVPAPCPGQSGQDSQSIVENQRWAAEARQALDRQDYKTALAAADKLAKAPASVEFQRVAGDTLLRCGEAKRAIEMFEGYLAKRPDDRPYLWQLGIAFYFDGKFKAGAELFEIHREVNPHDVENAAWHFLCVAKNESPEKAQQLLLPAPNDSRAPMAEVLEMLRSGDPEPVKQRMNSFTPGTTAAKSAKFYGHFYLGLYADALGDDATAKQHLTLAAEDSPRNYMGDIAKVYAEYLEKSE
ncbi:lipoprotein NlpI [Stieleria neptunia]|uniref:Lipoprotein NlpI n=1 Tax=Stieleria neptunia TaxID=2527979 RepID=A0A518HZX5_9BACT|nr:tetratricopeptide repeat protein [Stieleria neptunia]QDV46408.1 lipoprotein NlpI [Stieleria neptunia]